MRLLSFIYLLFISFLFTSTQLNAASLEKISENGLTIWVGDAPDWVDPWPMDNQASQYRSDGPTSYLHYDRQMNAEDDKQIYTHLVRRINNRSALEGMSRLEFSYNMAFEQLQLHQLNVIRDGRIVSKLKPEDIQLVHREDSLSEDMVYGYATAMILLKGTRPKDLIEYSFTIKGSNPVFGKQVSSFFDMGWKVPIGQSRLRVIQPKNRQFNISHRLVKVEPEVKQSEHGTEWVWLQKEIPVVDDQESYPSDYIVYPYVEITEYQSWAELAKKQLVLYPITEKFPAKLLSELHLIAKMPSQEDQVMAALNVAQEKIRYLGLELGVNAYQPHSVDQVWQQRSGDCKDKTNLLVSMLRYLEIEADPALVATKLRLGVAKYEPTPNVFDHVITRVVVDNKVYWLDPTRNPQYGKLESIGYSNYGKALVLSEQTNALSDMNQSQPEDNQIKIKEQFSIIDYGAPVQLNVETEYTGRFAEGVRYKIASTQRNNLADSYREHYSKYYNAAEEIESFKVIDDKENNRLTIIESYWLDQLLYVEDGRVGAGFYAADFYSNIIKPKTSKRNGPYYFGSKKSIKHEIIVRFPEEIDFNEPDPVINLSNDSFEFNLTEDYYAKELHLNFSLLVKNTNVPLQDFKKTYQQIVKARDALYQNRTIPYIKELDDPEVQAMFEELY